jgi:hypothetical protein
MATIALTTGLKMAPFLAENIPRTFSIRKNLGLKIRKLYSCFAMFSRVYSTGPEPEASLWDKATTIGVTKFITVSVMSFATFKRD